jgi:hypothetical protein
LWFFKRVGLLGFMFSTTKKEIDTEKKKSEE